MHIELYSGIVCPNEDGSFDLEVFYKTDGKHYITLTRTPDKSFSAHYAEMFQDDLDGFEGEVFTMAVNADTQIEKSV
jgi:hypothetical protein